MKLIKYMFFSLVTGILGKALTNFFDKNVILVADREDISLEEIRDINTLRPENYDNAMDLRGTPTHACVCGCNVWNLKVMFEDSQISQYFLDMECASCGSLATAPTPVDDRNELD
jgi:hypothetical protein